MSTTNHRTNFYPAATATNNANDQLFQDEQIQRFDADTIKNRYGENWRNFASNVREITQPDGSIVKGLSFISFLVLFLHHRSIRFQNTSSKIQPFYSESIPHLTMNNNK